MDESTRRPADADVTGERLSDDPDRPSTQPAVTGGVGAAAGAVTGAAVGTITAGPVGTIVGAIIGAVGGGWAGLASADSIAPTEEDEEYYRTHHGRSAATADADYERARPAYHLGHVAAYNPDYRGREFHEVEGDLRHGWTDEVRTRHGEWESVRPYAMEGWQRGRQRALGTRRPTMDEGTRAGGASGGTATGRSFTASELGGTDTHQRASYSDPLAEE